MHGSLYYLIMYFLLIILGMDNMINKRIKSICNVYVFHWHVFRDLQVARSEVPYASYAALDELVRY